ncbi:MAG: CoA transferase subunit A [bacterium]
MNATGSKVMSMPEAIRRFVYDGDSIAIEGFTHLICFAAAHEIIRQRKKELTVCRLTPDLIYDQLIAAGCVKKMIFSWAGNPGVGPLHALRRAVEKGRPQPIELEEYSHFGMAMRFWAGSAKLPFMPLRSYQGTDLPKVNSNIRKVTCPFTAEELYCVPALHPDVAIIHAQRADEEGNTQVWGLMGVQKEVAFASQRVIVVVEELVEQSLIRRDPNRTLIPGMIVNAVVVEPYGAHPSFAQGYYDRDNDFYLKWDEISKDERNLAAYLQEWIYDLPGRAAYWQKLDAATRERLKANQRLSGEVNYGY